MLQGYGGTLKPSSSPNLVPELHFYELIKDLLVLYNMIRFMDLASEQKIFDLKSAWSVIGQVSIQNLSKQR